MTSRTTGRGWLAFGAALSVVISLSHRAAAEELSIANVHPDVTSGVLVIDGTGFRTGLYVGIENVADLKVLSVSPTVVKTTLPALQPGSYRLEVRHAQHGESARFIVTIGGGAMGPAGPTGSAGPSGPQGPAGPMGPQGPQGLKGSTGPQGAAGAAGAQGLQGLQGAQGLQGIPGPAGSGPNIVAANGTVLGPIMAVTKFSGSDPVMVVKQDHGTWLAIGVVSNGLALTSYPILYTGTGCTGDAYAYVDASPTPLFRSLQQMLPTDTTAYYAGDPVVTQSFSSMQTPDPADPNATTCVSSAMMQTVGWGGTLPAGPLRTIDLSLYPAPYSVQ